ncbi:hypothetical protein MKW92_041461 [Papaver armeniacum]|nr:hypothetical protein MKW92_041461 [Papaver armeniacum]
MAWRGVFYVFFMLISAVDSSSRSGKVWSVNLGGELIYSWPVLTARVSVLVPLSLSLFLIFEHIAAYNQPEEQKFLIGIILMEPVYALESFLPLLDPNSTCICETMRDFYEAFALYCFERYLIACLGMCSWHCSHVTILHVMNVLTIIFCGACMEMSRDDIL